MTLASPRFALRRAHCVLLGLLLACSAHAAAPLGVAVSDAIMQRYTPTIEAMGNYGWDHSNSVVLHGMEKIYGRTRDKAYLQYIQAFADQFINSDGSIKALHASMDGMHPGVLCLFLYRETGDKKYLQAAKTMRDMMLGTAAQPSTFMRTPHGGYWHKSEPRYKNVMTVDGLYMAYPFLVRYALVANEPALLDLAASQILMVSASSFDQRHKLAYHGWDWGKEQPWAHPITGNSSQFWSRASGWYSMMLADVLEYLPPTHPQYGKLLFLFQDLAQGIKTAQHVDGFWYDVLDVPTGAGNFPETSGSGMMVYALQKGVNLKLLDPAYAAVAQRGWQALQTKVSRYQDGGPQINSVAPGMGVQKDYEAYMAIRPVSVPVLQGKHHPHGYIGVLMAASVMEK
jgi:unsaturated rhamnogalacturonyl hydrolase